MANGECRMPKCDPNSTLIFISAFGIRHSPLTMRPTNPNLP